MRENSGLAVVVLAAGKGKRMKSDLPKVLHPICGSTILGCVLEEVSRLGAGKTLVVVGHGAEKVSRALGDGASPVIQRDQKGTGHAVMVALDELDGDYQEVLVVPGDSPLIRAETMERLVEARRDDGSAASMLVAEMKDPSGYGRVIRGESGGVTRIVEEADAGADERKVKEVNACTYSFDRAALQGALEGLTVENAQEEYYLTGVVEEFVSSGMGVTPVFGPAEEVIGINNREQMADAAKALRKRINTRHMDAGVTLVDPDKTYIDMGVSIGKDTSVLPFVFITGETTIGENCRIGPFCTVNDSTIGDRCDVEYAWLDDCELEPEVSVGPFSRIRPGCRLAEGSKAGSFVEMKNTVLGRNSKVPHLSYMGDAEIGEDVNIGAGSITCNYDGREKHVTQVGDGAFIGSDTMFIAPVKIGEDAATGAGSAISEDVPDGGLGIERNRQKNVPGWRRRGKGRQEAGSEGVDD